MTIELEQKARELDFALTPVDKEHLIRKPKFKFCKSGTIIVSCKGSGHQGWYQKRKEEDIPECLRDFCRSCDYPKIDCEIELFRKICEKDDK